MGDVLQIKPNQPTSEELMKKFVAKFRAEMGLPTWKGVWSLNKALGEEVKVFRYMEERSFVITSSRKAKDSLLNAGCGRALEYQDHPGGPVRWDVQLPAYCWAWASDV